MTTTIHSCGSKWAGEEPDTIDNLLSVLAEQPLDRRFEDCGNFVMKDPEFIDGTFHTGWTHFFGNFLTVSYVFRIETTDEDVIDKLSKAIRKNQRRPDYRSQPKPKKIRAR